MAAAVDEEKPVPPPPPAPSEPRGLEWYLKARGVTPAAAAAAPAPGPAQSAAAKPELLGFEQTPSLSPAPSTSHNAGRSTPPVERPDRPVAHNEKHAQKKEAELFAYMDGQGSDSEGAPRPPSRLKRAVIFALALAACAIVAAPQAPWHPRMRVAWAHGHQTLRGWLNPQPATPVQAPVAHEDFGRAGDEYKLPVAEAIPDATTDPSQIQVVPVVDPTIRKPNSLGANAEPSAQPDATPATPNDQTPPTPPADPAKQPSQSTPVSGPSSDASIATCNVVACFHHCRSRGCSSTAFGSTCSSPAACVRHFISSSSPVTA